MGLGTLVPISVDPMGIPWGSHGDRRPEAPSKRVTTDFLFSFSTSVFVTLILNCEENNAIPGDCWNQTQNNLGSCGGLVIRCFNVRKTVELHPKILKGFDPSVQSERSATPRPHASCTSSSFCPWPSPGNQKNPKYCFVYREPSMYWLIIMGLI